MGGLEKQFCSCSRGLSSNFPRALRPCDPCVVGKDKAGRPISWELQDLSGNKALSPAPGTCRHIAPRQG